MVSADLVPAANKRLCTISREQLIERCNVDGVSFRSNVRMATLLNAANAHGLLALVPEPQTSILDLPMDVLEVILQKAMSGSWRRHRRQADVLFAAAGTCKQLYMSIMGDPDSPLWRTVWSTVARYEDQVASGTSTDDFGAPQPFMQRVKLLASSGCQFCKKYARVIHWQLGVRCCSSCFQAQTCTDIWARRHYKVPADLVALLPAEKVYKRAAGHLTELRVLKRDLCPLIQQVHGSHIHNTAAYEQHRADVKHAKAVALAARKQKAAARKARKLAKQQRQAAKKKVKEEAQQAKAAAKTTAKASGGAAALGSEP